MQHGLCRGPVSVRMGARARAAESAQTIPPSAVANALEWCSAVQSKLGLCVCVCVSVSVLQRAAVASGLLVTGSG